MASTQEMRSIERKNKLLREEGEYPYWEHGKYDPACSMCWLGYSHAPTTHMERVAK